jgi:hypothetical protein
MSTLRTEMKTAKAQKVTITEDSIIVDLIDGRTISAPIAWYPRLFHGRPEERNNLRLIGRGEGIHWPDLDEDVSIQNLLAGKPSGESQRSFQRWLKERVNQET